MSMGRNLPPAPEGKDQLYRSIFEAISDGLIIQDSKSRRVVEANSVAATMHGYSREEFIGLHPTQYIHPDNRRLFAESARTVQPGGVFESSEIHIRRDGSPIYVEVCTTAFIYQSRPCLLSDVRDVSKRVRADQLLYQQVEVRESEQSTLLDVSHTLASTLELKPELILDHLRAIVRYSRGALFVLEDSALVAVALHGVQQPEDAAPLHIPLDSPEILVRLFNKHRPIRIADLTGTDEQTQFLRSLLGPQAALLLDGMHAWMWVPLAVKGSIVGGIGVAQVERDYFTSHHADLALIVANQAAITMINAELYKNAQSLAVLEERQRLAQDLHDAVNQSLFSAGLIAEVLPRLWDRDQALARESLDDLRRLTRGAQAEMRVLLAELRPSTLTDSSLGDLLRLLGNALSGRINVPVNITIAGKYGLPAAVQIAFFRISQEALSNIAKHSKARRVEINLDKEGAVIELHIRDDGQGFDLRQKLAGHYGMSIMRERAEAVGIQLAVNSQPGNGTELTLQWAKPHFEETL